MLIVKLLLVSFFLIHNEVLVESFLSIFSASKPVVRSCTNILNRRTVLKPYHSRYNYIYSNELRYMGRSILTAKLVKNIRAPFPTNNWDRINIKEYEHGLTNGINDSLNDTTKIKDDLKDANIIITSMYYNLLALFCKKMDVFVHGKIVRENIEYYLDYNSKTIDFINFSMTELMYFHRGRKISIKLLIQLFYYSCGLKYTPRRKNDDIDMITIKQKFIHYLLKYPYFYDYKLYRRTEKAIIQELESSLRLISQKSCASFGVSISSLTMSILMEPSEDKVVKIIQRRRVSSNHRTVKDYIAFFTKKNDSDKIMTHHLNILGVLIIHVFGYVLNHFELLLKLRNFDLQEDDKIVIDEFSKFIDGYISIFVERYFEFKGEISQELVDVMFSVKYFLDPSDSKIDYDEDIKQEEKIILSKPIKPVVSILDYYDKSQKDNAFEKSMKGIISDAISILLNTFTETATDDWNNSLKINYDKIPLDKDALLKRMRINNDDFHKTLVIFSCEFSIEEELYDKYGLNDD